MTSLAAAWKWLAGTAAMVVLGIAAALWARERKRGNALADQAEALARDVRARALAKSKADFVAAVAKGVREVAAADRSRDDDRSPADVLNSRR